MRGRALSTPPTIELVRLDLTVGDVAISTSIVLPRCRRNARRLASQITGAVSLKHFTNCIPFQINPWSDVMGDLQREQGETHATVVGRST